MMRSSNKSLASISDVAAKLDSAVPTSTSHKYLKLHQEGMAFAGSLVYGEDAVPVDPDSRWVADWNFEVGSLVRDRGKVLTQHFQHWGDDAPQPALDVPPGCTVKSAYRTMMVGLSEPHVDVQVEYGGDSQGVAGFLNVFASALARQARVDPEKPFPVISFDIQSYVWREQRKIYKLLPVFHKWLSVEDALVPRGSIMEDAPQEREVGFDSDVVDVPAVPAVSTPKRVWRSL